MAVLFPIIFLEGMCFAYRRCGSYAPSAPIKKTKVVSTVLAQEVAVAKRMMETNTTSSPLKKKAKAYQEKKETDRSRQLIPQ